MDFGLVSMELQWSTTHKHSFFNIFIGIYYTSLSNPICSYTTQVPSIQKASSSLLPDAQSSSWVVFWDTFQLPNHFPSSVLSCHGIVPTHSIWQTRPSRTNFIFSSINDKYPADLFDKNIKMYLNFMSGDQKALNLRFPLTFKEYQSLWDWVE